MDNNEYVRDIPQEEYDWIEDPKELEEMDMRPSPEFQVEAGEEMNMAPAKEFQVNNEEYEMDMRPSEEYQESNDNYEMNMAPAPLFQYSYDEPDMNMAPSNSDDSDDYLGPVYEDLQKVDNEEELGRSR